MENDILEQSDTHKVYSTTSFAIGSVIGGPLAAAYMAASNYNHFGEPNKKGYAWITAILLMLVALATAFVPVLESIPGFIVTLFILLIVQLLVHRFQGKKIRHHIEVGGPMYPISRAVVIGLISAVVLFAVIFGVAFLLESITGLQF
jgi:hypothetical protein